MKKINSLFDLSGRTAIVSGGAGLLGAEFCITLAEAGASVVVADIDTKAALEVSEELKRRGFQAISHETDVTSEVSVQELIKTALGKFGKIDILVNSAALDPKFDDNDIRSNTEEFENYPLNLWQNALEVNLTGSMLCCREASKPMLKEGQGVIINISSIYGVVGPDQRLYQEKGKLPQYKPVYYSVTKAGILGLTRYLATYYSGKNIRVNALTPGGVFHGHDDGFLKRYSSRSILGRMAEKSEMNGALLFLASDASSYMTGANLVVDGGWTAW